MPLRVESPPGPAALGRGVIVETGAPAPGPWADAVRVVVDDDVLAQPADDRRPAPRPVGGTHGGRRRSAGAGETLRAPETDERSPHELTPAFDFARERALLPRAGQQLRRA